MDPLPGAKLHVGVSPVMRWPRASVTSTANRITSPCRPFARSGEMFAVTPLEEMT